MKIRPMREGDVNFVLSTWLKSYYEELRRNGHKGVAYPKDDVFFQGHQERIKKNLPSMTVMVATPSDDDNQIIGWLACDLCCVHYVYVKQVFRNVGVAKKLMATIHVGKYSHHTRFSKYLNKGLQYDPYKF